MINLASHKSWLCFFLSISSICHILYFCFDLKMKISQIVWMYPFNSLSDVYHLFFTTISLTNWPHNNTNQILLYNMVIKQNLVVLLLPSTDSFLISSVASNACRQSAPIRTPSWTGWFWTVSATIICKWCYLFSLSVVGISSGSVGNSFPM